MGQKDLKNQKALVKELIKSNKLTKDQREAYKQTVADIAAGADSLAQWKTLSNDVKNSIDDISDGLDYISKSYSDSLQDLAQQNIALNLQKSSLKKITSISNDLQDIRKGDVGYTDKQLKQLKEKADASYRDLLFAKELLVLKGISTVEEQQKLDAINKQISDQVHLYKGYEEIEKVNKRINNDLGFTPKILQGIEKGLGKIGLGDMGISEAIKETKRLGQEADMLGDKSFSAVGTFTKEIGKNILEGISLTKILELSFAALVDAGMKLDKLTGELANNLGLSYDESSKIQEKWNKLATDSMDAFITTENLGESFTALNKNLSNSTVFSDEMLEDFTELSKKAGISGEALGKIAQITAATGGDMTDITAEFQGQVSLLNKLNKTSMSEKQVLEEITKISSATTLTLGMQPTALAKAVYQAKALGLEMSQVESIASGLLDFESSIQNELQAEMLIGRDINLEKARQYALTGDIAGVAEEVANQIGTAADFTKMNVIQQEALAKSVGMTRNDLAKSLMEREALAKLGGEEGTSLERYNELLADGKSHLEIAKMLGKDKVDEQLKSESIQARFNQSIEKAKELFINLAKEFRPLISSLADGAMWIGSMVSKFGPFIKLLAKGWVILKGWQASLAIIKFLGDATYRTKILSNAAAKIGLITEQAAQKAQKSQLALGTSIVNIKKMKLFFEKQSLSTAITQGLKEKWNNALSAIGLGTEQAKGGVKKRNLLTTIATNVKQGISNALSAIGLGTTIATGVAENSIAAAKVTQNTASTGLITKGLTRLGIAVATAAASIAGMSALTLGIGTIAILAAAAAGVAWLYSISKPKKAGDILSEAKGKTQVSTKEGELLELSEGDDFVAAPGAVEMVKKQSKKEIAQETSTTSREQLQEVIKQNELLEQLMGINEKIVENTEKLKDLESVSFYEVQ